MKPYVILNSAMTLDGKITTKIGNSEISGLKIFKSSQAKKRFRTLLWWGLTQ